MVGYVDIYFIRSIIYLFHIYQDILFHVDTVPQVLSLLLSIFTFNKGCNKSSVRIFAWMPILQRGRYINKEKKSSYPPFLLCSLSSLPPRFIPFFSIPRL